MSPTHKRILIDPGHGGADPGAVAFDGTTEASLNLAIATRLAALFAHGNIEALLTRATAATLSLPERSGIANLLRPDLFVSIHCNAASAESARGIEVFTSPGQTMADPAATAVIVSLAEAFPEATLRTDTSDGDPDREARFAVLTQTQAPAMLIECGFMTNHRDLSLLTDPVYQERLARAIAKGIRQALRQQEATV